MKGIIMKKLMALREEGMTTSEYAVGTVGACSIGGILFKIASSDWFNNAVQGIFNKITDILPF